jgi:hypothetical protein
VGQWASNLKRKLTVTLMGIRTQNRDLKAEALPRCKRKGKLWGVQKKLRKALGSSKGSGKLWGAQKGSGKLSGSFKKGASGWVGEWARR